MHLECSASVEDMVATIQRAADGVETPLYRATTV